MVSIDMIVDIETGRRQWQVYNGNTHQSFLPAIFRGGCDLSELDVQKPVVSCTLRAGDLLYVPRGLYYRHFACTDKDTNDDTNVSSSSSIDDMASLHIILSPKHYVWSDYMSRVLARGVHLAAEQNVHLRQAVPRDMTSYAPCVCPSCCWLYSYYVVHRFMGVMHSDKSDDRRDQFITQFFDHLNTVIKSALLPFDTIADEQYRQLLHSRYPPWLPSDVPGRMSSTAAVRFQNVVSSSIYGKAPIVNPADSKTPVIIPGVAKTVFLVTILHNNSVFLLFFFFWCTR
jgi:hypothetical protein